MFWRDFEREVGDPVLAPSCGRRAAAGILPDKDGDGGSIVALELESSGRLQPSKMMSPRIYCFLEMLMTFPKLGKSLKKFENAARIVLVYKRVLFPLVYFQKLFWPTNFSW